MTTVRQLTAAGAPFVYAYYEGIDKVAHAEGLGPYYDDELRAADRLVGDVLVPLPAGSVLIVTADHGQVEVGDSVELLGPEIMEAVTLISGEGRFRWLHVRPGAADDVAEMAAALHGDVAGVRTKEQIVGGRIGSVARPRRRCRRAWATSPAGCRSHRRPFSTRRTPVNYGSWPGTGPSPRLR